jgi:hypothetical protein
LNAPESLALIVLFFFSSEKARESSNESDTDSHDEYVPTRSTRPASNTRPRRGLKAHTDDGAADQTDAKPADASINNSFSLSQSQSSQSTKRRSLSLSQSRRQAALEAPSQRSAPLIDLCSDDECLSSPTASSATVSAYFSPQSKRMSSEAVVATPESRTKSASKSASKSKMEQNEVAESEVHLPGLPIPTQNFRAPKRPAAKLSEDGTKQGRKRKAAFTMANLTDFFRLMDSQKRVRLDRDVLNCN